MRVYGEKSGCSPHLMEIESLNRIIKGIGIGSVLFRSLYFIRTRPSSNDSEHHPSDPSVICSTKKKVTFYPKNQGISFICEIVWKNNTRKNFSFNILSRPHTTLHFFVFASLHSISVASFVVCCHMNFRQADAFQFCFSYFSFFRRRRLFIRFSVTFFFLSFLENLKDKKFAY